MTSAVGFTGTSVSALYQILAEKDQPDGYVGLDANGKIPVQYLPDEIPKDFTDVEIKTNKNQPNGYPGLDAGGQLAASVIPPGAYILSSDKGAVNGVAPLDGTGTIYFTDLPVGTTSTSVAVGNHTHTGQFVLESQRNLPNGFAGLNGSSKIDFDNIPTGTTSTTVAVGNHAHVGQFEPIINPKRTAFNKDFGSSAGQVSEGNHKHNAGDLTSGTIPAARIPFGSVANTVAVGNHIHNYLSLAGGTLTGLLRGTSVVLQTNLPYLDFISASSTGGFRFIESNDVFYLRYVANNSDFTVFVNALTVNGGTGQVSSTYKIAVSDTTESVSSASGAVTTAGGLGVAKNINAGGTITPTSNPKYKENIKDYDCDIELLKQLLPKTYTRINDELNRLELGLCSTDLPDALNDVIGTPDRESINYMGLSVYLVGVCQQLLQRVEVLENA